MRILKNLLLFNSFLIIIGILVIGYVIVSTKIIKYKTKIPNNTNIYQGKVIAYKFKDDKLVLEVKGKEKIIVNYYYKNNDKNQLFNTIHLGDTISITGFFNTPDNNTIFNNFNYREYLYNNRIYTIWNASNIQVIKSNSCIFKIKDFLYKRAYTMSKRDYYLTFILGDKSLLSENDYHNYQINGISHIFSISGMHIGIILVLLNYLLKRYKYNNIIIILFLMIFIFFTNASPSVLRVVLFFVLNLLNKHCSLYFNAIQLLIITGYILIISNPFIVYDVGFIYSFIVTFGIMYYSNYIKGNYFFSLIKLSIITFIFSLPVTALLNYEINITSIINNIILVPLVSFIIFPLAIITFILPFLSPLFSLILFLFNIINNYLINLNILIIIPQIPIIIIILYYLVLLLIKKAYSIIILLLLIFFNNMLPLIDNTLYIYYLDVKQGDCTLIVFPYQKNVILIDTGGMVNNQFILDNNLRLLKSLGIAKINNLIITHGDFDHMGEAINLVNNIKVEKVIFNCGTYNDLEKDLIKVLNRKKIPYYSCIKELNIDNNKLYFLQTKEYDNENDNSNVIYTELNGYKFMFMGDAGVEKEKDILNKYNILNIDVLKVGHHGSKTSSSKEFINKINPKYSIISVGKNNRYGHPNKEVLNNLSDSKIYRTDKEESIMFKIKNNKLKIETCSP